jgi:WD40 repeat protein
MNSIKLIISTLLAFLLVGQAWGQEYKTLHTLQGHFGAVQNLRFSADGTMLASGGFDGYIILWDIKTGKVLKSIKAHRATVTEVTFSKDGNYVASCSQDGTAMVWDTKTGSKVATFMNRPFVILDAKTKNGMVVTDTIFQNGVSFVTFSPDSRFVYFSGDNGYIMKGEIATNKAQSIASTNISDKQWYSNVTGGTITSDSKYLVVTVGHHIKYLDLKKEKITQEIFYADADLNDVINAPMPNSIAVWSYEGKVTVWDNASKAPIKSYLVSEPDNYSAASFNRDGTQLLTSASGNDAKVWDSNTGQLLYTLGGHSRIVRLSRFSPTEDFMATGSYDGTIRIWKKEEKTPLIAALTPKEVENAKEVAIKNETTNVLVVTKKDDPKKNTEVVNNTKTTNTTKPDNTVLVENKLKFNEEVVEIGKTVPLQAIQFQQSSYVLVEGAYAELDKLVKFLKDNAKIEIEISGHTDNVGDENKNLTLSERRVSTVKFYLLGKGISEKRIQTKSFGGSEPIADNSTEAGRKQNRRVEMKFLKM